jgi:Flp pilus assembly pilin Flp
MMVGPYLSRIPSQVLPAHYEAGMDIRTGNEWLGASFHHIGDDGGATAIEYAVVASLIPAVIAASVRLLGVATLALFQSMPAVWP